MKDTRPDQGSGALAAVSARAAMDSIRSTNRASTNSSLVPNRGTHPDPGVTRDLVEADLKTALVTDLHGGRPEALPVPLGVRRNGRGASVTASGSGGIVGRRK
jgi:hypothetical protein